VHVRDQRTLRIPHDPPRQRRRQGGFPRRGATHAPLVSEADDDFDCGPKLTVTAIRGGDGYTSVPDACSIRVDIRLTSTFGADKAERLVRSACADVDRHHPSRQTTAIVVESAWPPYRLPPEAPVVGALRRSAEAAFSRPVPLAVAGPSNIGNYLASRGLPATCGFGVTYRNVHASDEAIDGQHHRSRLPHVSQRRLQPRRPGTSRLSSRPPAYTAT
jgi:acetylornithine deacetylase/succinyl-diaminopimelate desuccinylase-like protein